MTSALVKRLDRLHREEVGAARADADDENALHFAVAVASREPAARQRAPADDHAGYGDDQSGDGKQPYEDVAGRLIAQQDRQIVVVQEIEQPAIGAGAAVAQPGNLARCRVDEQGFFVRVRSNALGREP